MKIKQSYFSYKEHFNLKEIYGSMLNNSIPVVHTGGMVSFSCPSKMMMNEQQIEFPSAINICYIIPDCTPKELCAIHSLFNSEIKKELEKTTGDNTFEDDQLFLIFKGDNLVSASSIKHLEGVGVGWFSVFTSLPNVKIDDIPFDTVQLPQEKEDTFHMNIDMRFKIIMNRMINFEITSAAIKEMK